VVNDVKERFERFARCKDKGKTQYPPNFFATFFRHFEK
jgi:hypothetical protein